MPLQLATDNGPLAEVDLLLKRALELNPEGIEALEEAAHFYDAVMDNDENAVKYAALCREKAAALVRSMDEILLERRCSVQKRRCFHRPGR
jgi:hypothetical protein